MLWLIITLISYFLLAAVYLVDKHLLTATVLKPRVYTFYVGILSMIIVVIIPFIHFYIPPINQLLLSLITGLIFSCCLLWFYKGLNLFEASRIIPATGALEPFLTFILIFIISLGKERMGCNDLIAFILLIIGTILITWEKKTKINWSSLKYAFIIALLFSVFLILAKQIYNNQPFLNGLIWIKVGGFLFSLILYILYPEVRQSISLKIQGQPISKKTLYIFIANQIVGGSSGILQNWAIALSPIIYIPIFTALQGSQYVFLLFGVVLLSLKFPKILYEEVNRQILFQKIIATIIIGIGIAILAFK